VSNYIIRRLLLMVPTILGASILIFGIMRILPGDVALMILQAEDPNAQVDAQAYEQLKQELGLNKPLAVQYVDWIGGVLRGDLGNSLRTRSSVASEIMQRLPISLQIALMASAIGMLLGVPLGVLAAFRQDTWCDYGLRGIAAMGLAMPSFWIGIIILVVGARFFQWSPPIGYNPIWKGLGLNLTQLIWPGMVIGLAQISILSRMARSSMLEVLREDYVRTARAKGLSERLVVLRHALRNAFIPVLTLAGLSLGFSLGGSVVMETIFTIPGMGLLFIEAARWRDYTVVQGLVLWMVLVFTFINLLIDLTYSWLDPRIRY
jgi:peptide/nickel transport system permease protein